MRLILLLLTPLALLLTACPSGPAVPTNLSSSNESLLLHWGVDSLGVPYYQLHLNDEPVIESSPLGLVVGDTDLGHDMRIASVSEAKAVTDDYTLLHGKRAAYHYAAKEITVDFAPKEGLQLSVIFRLADDGLAFRYRVMGESTSEFVINSEQTTFDLPADSRGWLHPHAVAQSGWEHTQPSYEENYEIDIPVGTPSTLGQGWSFPALFKTKGAWILISETDMGRHYCGSHLGHESLEGAYRIAFPQAPERITPDGALFPTGPLPLESPWRTLTVGADLGTIVESTHATDLARPAPEQDVSYVEPGQASWSWVVLKDDSTIYPVQKRFIDYASDMNWEYCLIDSHWDRQIGYDSIQALARYAQSKDVGILMWYSSNGHWNTAPLPPRDLVFDPEIRRAEFAKLQEYGIRGLKIDFFGGDGQSFMAYYQDLMEDAARYQLTVNFHGATIPRGWQRTYPNLMTMESVKGFEFITFEQPNADRGPRHCAVLPFTRNVIGPMDFTPMCFGE
ncbi:MAG: glycoside hydrolase family 97 catalytic domain-containing protein, partial [Lewinella sp.]|nr:glycoside hydrolase family 97 catalytic domain-containing protein [Lewinella sp.]